MVHRSVWGPSPRPFGCCAGLAAAPAASVGSGVPDERGSASALASVLAAADSLPVCAVDCEPAPRCSDASIPSMMAPSCAALAGLRYRGFMSENRDVTPRRSGRRTYADAAATKSSPSCRSTGAF